jgi:hypothetical protein
VQLGNITADDRAVLRGNYVAPAGTLRMENRAVLHGSGCADVVDLRQGTIAVRP